MMLLIVTTVLLAVVVTRVVYVLYSIYQGKPLIVTHKGTVKTLIVLGSGGHTVEMLKMVAALDPKKYRPRIYMVADTDEISHKKVMEVERNFKDDAHYTVEVVPRTREVRQSWVTSVFTTLRALLYSLSVLVQHKPLLVLSNGPGTCVPVCAGAVMLRVIGLYSSRVVFVESVCRVHSLSLSGHLLYPLSDHFLVQWPYLTKTHKKARYIGRLV